MTDEAGPRPGGRERLGPLGRRLVAAFSVVALAAVALVALAAQQAVRRGVDLASSGDQAVVAGRIASALTSEVAAAGGWDGVDVGATLVAATDAGFAANVLDEAGTVLAATDVTGRGGGREASASTASVLVGGVERGVVRVWQPGGGTGGGTGDGTGNGNGMGHAMGMDGGMGAAAQARQRGLDTAWSWIAGAAVGALALAVLAGWLVTRWLTAPLTGLAAVAHAFGRGDHSARADERATGELGELARGFNEAVDAVERSAAARRQMAADVAHELRTPLAALQAGLEELRDGHVPPDPEALGRLHDQTLRLGRVVGDLTLLSSADEASPAVVHGRVDVGRLVADALAARLPELRAAGLTATSDLAPGAVVLGDSDRLHQAVGNLLANCARHCRPGDRVEITVRASSADVHVVVADSGPGIAPEDRDRAFDRYWRAAGSRGVEGSGLGLAVVREVATAHGGRVTADATPGGGTTVTLVLPRAGEG